MCGRFTLASPADLIREMFDLDATPDLPPRYNIAPSQPAAVVRRDDDSRRLHRLRWGLVPHWADDPATGHRMINARAETAADKPAFRDPFRHRRCLIPADGFYEWQKLPGGRKQPFYLRRQDGRPFAFAGLWDRWRPPDGTAAMESFTIITTSPSDDVAPLHDRMPAILDPGAFSAWLEPEADPRRLRELLAPYRQPLRADPVSSTVNDPGHDSPRCIEPVSADPGPPRLFD